MLCFFFFFNDTATTEIYTLSLHDALPISRCPFHKETKPSFSVNPAKDIFYCFGCQKGGSVFNFVMEIERVTFPEAIKIVADRKSTRLNSSHSQISYAVFCLKKKKRPLPSCRRPRPRIPPPALVRPPQHRRPRPSPSLLRPALPCSLPPPAPAGAPFPARQAT